MGKINKFSNIYNKDGSLRRSVNKVTGKLDDLSFKELQDLVDKLGTEKDENGKLKDINGFNNASAMLINMYNDPKYAEERNNFIKQLHDQLRNNKQESAKALKETAEELENKTYDVNSSDSEYVEYEEVQNEKQ